MQNKKLLNLDMTLIFRLKVALSISMKERCARDKKKKT